MKIKMIDKRKFRQLNRLTISIVAILLILLLIRVVYSAYQTDGEGKAISEIAFYVVNSSVQTQNLQMFDLEPSDEDYTYDISVSNFENNKTSDVDMQYNLEITTTTNIPVTYKLYLNGGPEDIIGTKEIISDNNGTYFFKFTPSSQTFTHGVQKTDNYQLVVNFPSQYNSEEYQDLIENVEIKVDAKQM